MSTDDKYGIGAGLLALGLAAGIILLGQVLPADVLSFLPHRDPNRAEQIFDGIVCGLCLPAGVFFFASAILSSVTSKEADREEPQG